MKSQEIKYSVETFRERTAFGKSVEHCFAPWYLNQIFQVPEDQALAQSSDGSYDFGLDAFVLYDGEPPRKLLLLQAKYTESIRSIGDGFREFERKTLPEISKVLQATGSSVPVQNKVLVNLRAALNRLEPTVRARLRLDFRVLHLCNEDGAIISLKTKETRTRLSEGIREFLPRYHCTIEDVGPGQMGLRQEVITPAVKVRLSVQGIQSLEAGNCRMFYGIGKLADLVDMYTTKRDYLFSKNVRYFLYSKSNMEKGAAGKMRETLKRICVEEQLEPEIFALYHNGVTLHARSVERSRHSSDGVLVTEPFVLNGCQTIKNAFFFRNDPHLKDRIVVSRWKRVEVPLRIIETSNEDVVRTVTINNNRQNAISYAALRANDSTQIALEHRFHDMRIYYERQEGAYANLENTSPEVLEDEYENTRGEYANIIDLGRSLAATAGEISLAERPSDLFESDAAYTRCFSERRLSSVVFLTFLQNLHDIIGLVLKKDLNLESENGPKPSRLKYYSMCLVARYLAKANKREFVIDYGRALWGRDWEFRQSLGKLMRSSGIRRQLAQKFIKLETTDADSLHDAFEQAERALRLRNVEPFEIFKRLGME